MNHQHEHVVWIQDWNLEESDNGIHPVSDKFQRCLKSACGGWIFQRWYEIFFGMCVIALWLDPLFCFSLVINDDKKCLRVDRKLGTIAIVLRSVMDFLYVIHVIFKFCTEISLPRAFKRGVFKGAWAISKRLFIMDLLSVLPLPQVVLLIITSQVIEMGFLNATKSLILVLVLQYVPRVLRIYPFFITFRRTSGILIESAWAKAAFNLLLYMLASHVVGAFWYLFAVRRKTMCWQEACKNRIGCVRISCDDILGDYTFLTDTCPIRTPNVTIFNFGIFLEALDSGIVDSTDFLRKFSYSFWFGLQSLSSLGQNLKTSSYFWEIVFAVIITIFGLVLFAILIGNMQTYLQLKTVRLEEMRLKRKEIDQWMGFHSLPQDLKYRVSKYQKYKWQKTRGVDVENLLCNLPKNLRRDIKRHLCLALLMRVPMFEKMDEQLSDAMCDRLKPVLYTEESYIVREGDPVDEMLFIMRGKLSAITTNGGRTGFFNVKNLKAGDFCGEELLTWALDPSSNLPISTRTIRTLTEVEAYAVMADDLKFVGSQFRRLHSKQLRHTFRFYSLQWRTWAACYIQAAWRRYSNKKLRSLFGQRRIGYKMH